MNKIKLLSMLTLSTIIKLKYWFILVTLLNIWKYDWLSIFYPLNIMSIWIRIKISAIAKYVLKEFSIV